MTNKKGKFPPVKTPDDAKVMRSIVREGLTAVIASENPVERWDEERQMVVREVLLMSGLELRGGRNQLPIVDSHNDRTVRNIFGSIRNIRVEGTSLVGETSFASDEESQAIRQRMDEGHITDFSISANILDSSFIARGQAYTTEAGDRIEGPAIIVTRWTPYNASICATGADEQSMVRRSYTDLKRKVLRMDEALLAQLSTMGLPEGMTDPNQVLAWVVGKMKPEEAPEAEVVEAMAAPEEVAPVVENMASEEPKPEDVAVARQAVETQVKRALKIDQTRRKEIRSACELAKLERAFADELCDGFVSVSDARKRIIERMATQPVGSSVGADVRVTASESDKFYAAARDGLLHRAQRSAKIRRSMFEGDKPAAGYEDFTGLNLNRLAMAFLTRAGAPVHRMSNTDIAQAAMGNQRILHKYGIERSDFGAYHTSGSFTNLLLDASNKTLLAGYEEAPYSWMLWARQATSVEDFKAINRTRFSEASNPEAVPEGADYPEKAMSDSRESYTPVKYGEVFTVTWETIVNDDLDAISRVPAMHGNAMRRLQNKKVYEVLTSNPNMGDGNPLFSSSHASGDNTSGSAAAPGVTTLNAGFAKMMVQKGLTTDAILNIQPRYLIVPVNYSATALQLVGSMADPGAGGSAAGNSNTLNLYGPQGSRPLQVIVEPQLDASSTTTWYLAADNGQVDTVEIAFLQGEESPVLESEWNMKNDTYLYKVRQTFGVKAIDWRGLYRNA